MSMREITIERLHLTLQRSQAPGGRRDADALAKSIAASLAGTLKQRGPVRQGARLPGRQPANEVRVVVPRDQAHPDGIARAIGAAIGFSGEER
jgi:hypothetical protein